MNNFFDLIDFIDKEKNKISYVCGMGPSLKEYLPLIENTKNIIVTCSDVDTMTNIIPNYWVFANSADGSAIRMNDRWKKLNDTIIVHADSVDVTPTSWIKNNVTNTYIGYDQRHFDDSNCNDCPNKCSNRVPNRKTIQELLMNISNYDRKYSTGHTVAVHCLSLAILLGCTEIYLFGIDLDYSLGYVDNKTTNNGSFVDWLPEIIEDFRIINESAKKLGVKIYNTSMVSPLKEIFENKTIL
jgi:hypothetical protein